MRDQLLDRHAAQREALATRQHRHGDFVHLGRREDEFDVRRRLLERLQQRVEGVLRQHVHFVDDVDLVPRRDRAIAHALGQVTDIVDTGARGGVHLDDIDMAVLGDGPAMNAFAAGRYRRRTGPVGADAIERAGDDPCRRGFADPAHTRQDESLRDAALGDRVRQGADHRLLPDHLGKGLRPVFAGEDAIACRGIRHCGHCGAKE